VHEQALQAILKEHGDPAKAVALEKHPVPKPGPGEVLVEMLAASINPADLNILEGSYPVRPAIGGTCGMEGVGIVRALGDRVDRWHLEDRVVFPRLQGTWCERLVVPQEELFGVSRRIPVEQAAMLQVNPATAHGLLHNIVGLDTDEWLIQNAANSAVGRLVIQLAHRSQRRTLNVVRRGGLEEDLRNIGADVVLLDDDELPARVRDIVGDGRIRLGLNAVGGDSASRLVKCLTNGGALVTYGAMSREPVRASASQMIFRDIRYRGFWVSRWYRQAPDHAIAELLDELGTLFAHGYLESPVEATYPLSKLHQAIEHARQPRRAGKIVLLMR